LLSPTEAKDEIQQHYLEGLELKRCRLGPHALTVNEKRELLLDRDAIVDLHNKLLAHDNSTAA